MDEIRKSEITENIVRVLECKKEDIVGLSSMNGGESNYTYKFTVAGNDYVYRYPGVGTDKIINRMAEKEAIVLASEMGLDPTYIAMDAKKGWKISRFVHEFRQPDYESDEDSVLVAGIIKQLHQSGKKTAYQRNIVQETLKLEKMACAAKGDCLEKDDELRNRIKELYSCIKDDGVDNCFCHCDVTASNMMILRDGVTYLIDWEYSAVADPGLDVGTYIVDGDFDIEKAKAFIKAYLGEEWTESLEKHFIIYVAITSYYWLVWHIYKETQGEHFEAVIEKLRSLTEYFLRYID